MMQKGLISALSFWLKYLMSTEESVMNKHLKKPIHKEEVIATARGWEVARTGEVLVSVKGLDQMLAETLVALPIVETDINQLLDGVEDNIEDQDESSDQPYPAAPKVLMGYHYSPYLVKKKMGRPAGSKNSKQ